jgi:hypothetical protein
MKIELACRHYAKGWLSFGQARVWRYWIIIRWPKWPGAGFPEISCSKASGRTLPMGVVSNTSLLSPIGSALERQNSILFLLTPSHFVGFCRHAHIASSSFLFDPDRCHGTRPIRTRKNNSVRKNESSDSFFCV